MRIRYYILTMVCLLLMSSHVLTASDPMKLSRHALVWGGSCEQVEPFVPKILAGSDMIIIVYNSTDLSRESLEAEDWPKEYYLEVALDYNIGDIFVNSPELLDRISPFYFIGAGPRSEDAKLKSGKTDIYYLQRNAKHFRVHIPDDLVGHSIAFRAKFQHGVNALVSPIEPTAPPIQIIPPCDEFDSARVIASRVYSYYKSDEFARSIEEADSMLANNLIDIGGWYYAYKSASAIGSYEKMAVYTQKMWGDYGMLEYESEVPSSELPVYNPNGYRPPALIAKYEERMNWLQEKISEQEQQDD